MSLGKITITGRSTRKIETGIYCQDDFGYGGICNPVHIMVSDNYYAPDAEDAWRLYVMPSAAKAILDHIHWGERHSVNTVEQGGYLLGTVFKDEEQNISVCRVEAAVPAMDARGTGAFLVIEKSDLMAAHTVCDKLNCDRSADSQLRFVGWFHTHPNGLDVFMSGTDRHTQSSMFSGEDAFAIVMNPHRRIWKCYRSGHCIPVKAQFLLDRDTVGKRHSRDIRNKFSLE